MADGCAMLLPFIGDCRELARAHPAIVIIQFPENTRSQLGPRYGFAGLQFERRGQAPQFSWKISCAQIYIHADTENYVFHPVQLSIKLRENPSRFFSVKQKVIGPLDFRLQASLSLNGATERGCRGDRQLSYFLRPQIRTKQDRKPKPLLCRRSPLAPEPSPAFGLGFCKYDNAFFQAVAREFLRDVVGRSGFLEDSDVAPDYLRSAQARKQIISVQSIRSAQQPIAQVRAGFDVVSEGPQVRYAGPNGGAADADFLGQLGAAGAGVVCAQGF